MAHHPAAKLKDLTAAAPDHRGDQPGHIRDLKKSIIIAAPFVATRRLPGDRICQKGKYRRPLPKQPRRQEIPMGQAMRRSW